MPTSIATSGTCEDDLLASTSRHLLGEPLEFLLADHHGQRGLCNLLDTLADRSGFCPALASRVADYIASDLAVHVIDEEEDLFPLLRRRARPEDNVERVLGLLAREHAEDDRLAVRIVEGLRAACAAGDEALPEDLRLAARSFAQRQRRHLAVENAIVIPLAEARLDPGDRRGLSRRMAARRGIRLAHDLRHA